MRSNTPLIYAFWHRYQLLLAHVHRNEGLVVLVSRSRDGELIARTVERLGYRTVRGSSGRGGAVAFLSLLQEAKRGRRLVFTPDGPRGPYKFVQPGVVAAAHKTGFPVVPVAWAATRVKTLKSWDRFLVPLPFATFHIVYGPPIMASDNEEKTAVLLHAGLESASEEAERWISQTTS